MKFRFCGDADCPDWLLMQINSLSTLEPYILKKLCELVVEPLIGKDMNYSKLRELSRSSSLDSTETKACVSALTHIFKSGSCYGVTPSDLGQELEQLGLDRQHSQVIVKLYSNQKGDITERLKDLMLRTGTCLKAHAETSTTGTVYLELTLADFNGKVSEHRLHLSRDQANVLLTELKLIRNRMEELQAE